MISFKVHKRTCTDLLLSPRADNGPDDVTEVGEGVGLHLEPGHHAGVHVLLSHLHLQGRRLTQGRVHDINNLDIIYYLLDGEWANLSIYTDC